VLGILRLDRGIQSFQYVLDCPVKPDNDDIKVFACRVNNISTAVTMRFFFIINKGLDKFRNY
jgi:hypothetical protein